MDARPTTPAGGTRPPRGEPRRRAARTSRERSDRAGRRAPQASGAQGRARSEPEPRTRAGCPKKTGAAWMRSTLAGRGRLAANPRRERPIESALHGSATKVERIDCPLNLVELFRRMAGVETRRVVKRAEAISPAFSPADKRPDNSRRPAHSAEGCDRRLSHPRLF